VVLFTGEIIDEKAVEEEVKYFVFGAQKKKQDEKKNNEIFLY